MLIAIEGTDAAGKNTMAKLLVERLVRLGRKAVMYSVPRYETEIGKAIKRHLMNDIMVAYEHSIDSSDHKIDGMIVHRRAPEDAMVFQTLMTVDKYDAAPEIEAHLYEGTFVVCDRWIPSAVAFGMADGLPEAWLWRIQRHLPQADLNIFLRVSEEEALRRRPQLRDRYEKDREKQAVVRANYEHIWDQPDLRPNVPWVTVDANGPSVEAVHAAIWAMVVGVHNAMFLHAESL